MSAGYPASSSRVDQRLVRERCLDRCSHPAMALYLFLVTVSDAMGLSYYGDASIASRLSMDDAMLAEARNELLRIGLIAYRKRLYQVLDLAEVNP